MIGPGRVVALGLVDVVVFVAESSVVLEVFEFRPPEQIERPLHSALRVAEHPECWLQHLVENFVVAEKNLENDQVKS